MSETPEESEATPPATLGFNETMRDTLLRIANREHANPSRVRALLRRGLAEGPDTSPALTAKGRVVLDAINSGRPNEDIRKLF